MLNLLPRITNTKIAIVRKLKPPISISKHITILPKIVKSQIGATASPVTQVAEILVNKASTNESDPSFFDIGKSNNSVPINITIKKLIIT